MYRNSGPYDRPVHPMRQQGRPASGGGQPYQAMPPSHHPQTAFDMQPPAAAGRGGMAYGAPQFEGGAEGGYRPPGGSPSGNRTYPRGAAVGHAGYSAEPVVAEAFVSRTLYVCRIPQEACEADIRTLCEPFGELRKVAYYPAKGIAFVEFWDIRCAETVRNQLKNPMILNRPVEIQYSRVREDRRDNNTGTVYVRPMLPDGTSRDRNFRDHNSLDDYRDLFGRFGEVKKVNPNRKREAEKFIEYYDLRAAEAALQLNGYNFNGLVLEVQMANHVSKTVNRDSKAEVPAGVTRSYGAPRGGRPAAAGGAGFREPADPYANPGAIDGPWRQLPTFNLLFTGSSALSARQSNRPFEPLNLGVPPMSVPGHLGHPRGEPPAAHGMGQPAAQRVPPAIGEYAPATGMVYAQR